MLFNSLTYLLFLSVLAPVIAFGPRWGKRTLLLAGSLAFYAAWRLDFLALVVFSATVEGGLSEIGRISTRYLDAERYWSSFTRGVFIGDDCLAVTNNGIRRTAVPDTEAIIAELLFE